MPSSSESASSEAPIKNTENESIFSLETESPQLPSRPAYQYDSFLDSPLILLLQIIIPKVPLILRTSLLHFLRISEQSRYLDIRSNITVQLLRAILEPSAPRPLSFIQNLTQFDVPVRGRIWVSQYAAPAPPEDDIVLAVLSAAENLQLPNFGGSVTKGPLLEDVEAEWTGYRPQASFHAAPPLISEKEKYQELVKDCKNETTMLYFHGGAYYLCDPCNYRGSNKELAKVSGGKVYSVRYRLAPQHPFPAALVDAFLSYLTLLYPPPGAYHEPVKAEHIVFAGDSAGGNLSLALLQLILQLHRQGTTTIRFHGSLQPLPLPRAVACCSPWLDITQSAPTWESTSPTPYDYLPKPEASRKVGVQADAIWPATPPRNHLYADDHMVAHPLVSLVTARNWEGSPPIWISSGWEILNYEHRYFAKKLFDQGVCVHYEEWEAMPHCFPVVFPGSQQAKLGLRSWAEFTRDVVGEDGTTGQRAIIVKSRSFKRETISFEGLSQVTHEEMLEMVKQKAADVPQMMIASPHL